MVRTRHTPGADEESPGSFLSIDKRRSRLRRHSIDLDEGSDDSGVVQFKKSNKLGSIKHHDETPLGKRSLRTSKRISYVEDYIDFPRTRTRGRAPNVSIEDETDDDNIDVKMDGSPSGAKPSRVTRHRKQSTESHIGDMDDDYPPRRRTRRSDIDHEAKKIKAEALAMNEEHSTRRSSRSRKLMDSSFDEKNMEQSGYITDEEPKSKRPRLEVDTDSMPNAEDDEEYKDMYSRVKRKRINIKRDMYGMPIEESDEEENDDEADSDDSDDDSDDDDSNNDEANGDDNEGDDDDDHDNESKSKEDAPRSYYLRQNKPRTQLYNAPLNEKRPRTMSRFFNEMTHHSPARRRRPEIASYMSPARMKGRGSRRRAAFHGSSSTSSSSSDSSDEEKFQRRKAKSMKKSRQRCLPMNFDLETINSSNILRDRQKVGSSLADVDPMALDRSITFDSVGGLGKHIRALKEMVVFPLMYPEIFERFKIAPPRGVLFYGPPGTGKTLVARALANECSAEDRRVAFYMRKGADCLSKWVGESERQLRLLFDQAYQTRPSIIFFDEIDGLAPVRSSRQDQIHSSIVSTLLALMDGLDSRGEIVVIGATNRIDSIDPALRRPGRFDREFLFPLPSVQARSQILKINTKDWNPKLCEKFIGEVAEHCTGYCGADMKALCTEAALLALRRRYPQIYTSAEKLQIDVSSINVIAKDFFLAMQNIVPTSQRSLCSPGRALNSQIAPLLMSLYKQAIEKLNEIFPSVLSQLANLDTANNEEKGSYDTELDEDENEGSMSIYEHRVDKRRKSIPEVPDKFLNFTSYANQHPSTHRPRLLLSGNQDQGQTSHLAPAIIHHMEQLPVHVIDLSTLFAVSARTPEEGCAQIFREARRTAPSIIYLPHINQWWNVLPDTVKMTLLTLIQDIIPSSPLLILATSEDKYTELDFNLQDLFDEFSGEVITMRNPTQQERHAYFKDLLLNQATTSPPQKKLAAKRLLEVLPKAPPPKPRALTEQELKKVHESEEATLRELRLFLRDVLNKLGRDRKFFIFTKPVDVEDVPDYYEIIRNPMDLSTMMTKIDLHHYTCVKEFLEDIEQICCNALEYNPDTHPQSRVIRHRACALRDTAYAIMKVELDPEFEKACLGIVDSRKKRGDEGNKTVPAFYHTRPLNPAPGRSRSTSLTRQTEPMSDCSISPNVRLSQRLRRGQVDEGPSLEEVERSARRLRREAKQQASPEKKNENEATNSQDDLRQVTPSTNKISGSKQSQGSSSRKKMGNGDRTTSGKKKPKKNIWGRSSYKKRRKVKRKRSGSEIAKEEIEDEEGISEDDEEEEDSGSEIEMDDETEKESISEQSQNNHTRSRRDSLSKCLSVEVNLKPPSDNPRSPNQRSPRGESQKSPSSEARSQIHASPTAQSEPLLRSARPESGQKSPRCRHTSGQVSPRVHESVNPISSECHPKSAKCSLAQKFQDKSIKLSHPNSVHDICETSNHASAQESVTQDKSVAPSEAEGVPVVNGFIDSGVGSSDSNGDSNDSGGKITTSENTEKTPSKQPQVSATMEDMEQTPSENNQAAPSPQFRVTRSRIQTKTQEKALEILQSQFEPLVVDRERLVRLLDMTVLLTEGYDISKLEKLYSILGQCIYQHRLEFNKMNMIEVMERRLKQFTSCITERLKSERARTLAIS